MRSKSAEYSWHGYDILQYVCSSSSQKLPQPKISIIVLGDHAKGSLASFFDQVKKAPFSLILFYKVIFFGYLWCLNSYCLYIFISLFFTL
jgi:hypothetical protein